jgi:hypothetical protein
MCSLLLLAAILVAKGVQGVPLSQWSQGTASFFGGPQVCRCLLLTTAPSAAPTHSNPPLCFPPPQDSNSNAYKVAIDSGSCGECSKQQQRPGWEAAAPVRP